MRIPILLLAAHVTFPNFLLNFLAVWPCCLNNHLTLFPFPSTQVSRKEKYSPKPSREKFLRTKSNLFLLALQSFKAYNSAPTKRKTKTENLRLGKTPPFKSFKNFLFLDIVTVSPSSHLSISNFY